MRLNTPEGNHPPSRRLIAGSIFTIGYAAAALSASADPITTPTDGLILEDVHVAGAEGYALPAYVARPETVGAHPCIIVVNEIFGIHAYIKDICARFAKAGYVAIAPDYFDRAGDPSTLTDWDQIRAIVQTAGHQQVMDDTAGAIAWLGAQSFAKADAIGITGFCWGGKVVWMSAALLPQIKAGVAWYGRLTPPDGQTADATWPITIAPTLKTPVLGLYGAHDNGIPVASVEAMRVALASTGNQSGSEIVIYPDAGHGFHADYRDSYNAADAADGWARALAWFRAHGVA